MRFHVPMRYTILLENFDRSKLHNKTRGYHGSGNANDGLFSIIYGLFDNNQLQVTHPVSS